MTLVNLGKKNNVELLIKYSDELSKYIEKFKIEKLEEEFLKFPEYIKQLMSKKEE